MKKFFFLFSFFISSLFTPSFAYAHEAYVLTHKQFLKGIALNTAHPLAGLINASYLPLTLFITICVIAVYSFFILWAATPWAAKLDGIIKKAKVIGPFTIRLAISASFFFSAMSNVVFGPELSLQSVVGGEIIRFILFALSLMIFFGIFVEAAGLIGLLIFMYISNFFGIYMLTYLNYLGELIVLLLFGSRVVSFDRVLFGKKAWFTHIEKLRNFEIPVVRILYGLALIYAGWSIKFQHQLLSVEVYNEYHLHDFFHASAQFIASGAGLSEIVIGLFILLGFAQRLTVLISLFFITLSLLYFKEMLWPHLMLYGISFSLIINSADMFTIDRYLPQIIKACWRFLFPKRATRKKLK